MDHDLELISPILEILEIEVSNILYNPGNIGKLTFSIFSYPVNIGNLLFPISHMVKYGRRAGGSIFFSFRSMFLEFCDMSNLRK